MPVVIYFERQLYLRVGNGTFVFGSTLSLFLLNRPLEASAQFLFRSHCQAETYPLRPCVF